MTKWLRDDLISSLSRVTFDEKGESSKGLMVMVGEMPYPDVVGVDVNEDNIVLKVKVFQE